jgi:imidazolonepropionase-like amidohydrolase
MNRAVILLTVLTACSGVLTAQQISIRAGTLLDGKGGMTHNATIVVEGTKIIRIDPSIKYPTYDLSKLTVMPGWI